MPGKKKQVVESESDSADDFIESSESASSDDEDGAASGSDSDPGAEILSQDSVPKAASKSKPQESVPVPPVASSSKNGKLLKKRVLPSSDSDSSDFEDSKPKSKLTKLKAASSPSSSSPSSLKKAASPKAKVKVTETPSPKALSPNEKVANNKKSNSTSNGASNTSKQIGSKNAIEIDVAQIPTLSNLQEAAMADITRGPDVPTEAGAKKLIMKYLKQQNRPYSAIQIYDNLHHRVLRGTVERVCDDLANTTGSGFVVKEYGKSKLYFPDQRVLLESMRSSVSLDTLINEFETKDQHLKSVQTKEKSLHSQVKSLVTEPTDALLNEVLQQREETVASLKKRVQSMSGANMDPDACLNAVKKFNFYRSKWCQQKGSVMEVVGNIADGMEKKLSVVQDQLGIVTDKEVGFDTIPPPMNENI
jgi:hypothetical protein